MRRLFIPVLACLALSGCALPLLQVVGAQMKPSSPACAYATACPDGMSGVMGVGMISGGGSGMFGGAGTSLQTLAGVASTERTGAK